MDRLRFSRCTDYPFVDDFPHGVVQRDGRFLVMRRETLEELGPFDAREAVQQMVSLLPPDCGPAVLGSARDLGRD